LKTKLLISSFLFFIPILFSNAQTKSNIDIVYNLIDHSIAKADSILEGKKSINLSVTTTAPLDILKSKVFLGFSERGYSLQSSIKDSSNSFNYTINSVSVNYSDPFSDGFFGGVGLVRKITLNGSLTILKSDGVIKPVEFAESLTDTVNLNEISSIENKSIPFTQGQIPSEPLLSTFWEPIIVVGTLIVTVILLFTVRGK
jgi:hypothetical protein